MPDILDQHTGFLDPRTWPDGPYRVEYPARNSTGKPIWAIGAYALSPSEALQEALSVRRYLAVSVRIQAGDGRTVLRFNLTDDHLADLAKDLLPGLA